MLNLLKDHKRNIAAFAYIRTLQQNHKKLMAYTKKIGDSNLIFFVEKFKEVITNIKTEAQALVGIASQHHLQTKQNLYHKKKASRSNRDVHKLETISAHLKKLRATIEVAIGVFAVLALIPGVNIVALPLIEIGLVLGLAAQVIGESIVAHKKKNRAKKRDKQKSKIKSTVNNVSSMQALASSSLVALAGLKTSAEMQYERMDEIIKNESNRKKLSIVIAKNKNLLVTTKTKLKLKNKKQQVHQHKIEKKQKLTNTV